jgi:uncharacterized iron-regulated membrane protein
VLHTKEFGLTWPAVQAQESPEEKQFVFPTGPPPASPPALLPASLPPVVPASTPHAGHDVATHVASDPARNGSDSHSPALDCAHPASTLVQMGSPQQCAALSAQDAAMHAPQTVFCPEKLHGPARADGSSFTKRMHPAAVAASPAATSTDSIRSAGCIASSMARRAEGT